jgi:predicted acyltransferase (DUF342 family)
MSPDVVLFGAAFLTLLFLPFLPGVLELRRKRDVDPLPIQSDNTKDPRHFGRAFRALLERHVPDHAGPLPLKTEIKLRRTESLEVHEEVSVGPGEKSSSILVSTGNATIGRDARVGEIYATGDARVKEAARIRGLACDGSLIMQPGCVVERWIDSEGNASVGAGCDLGVSASAGGRIKLASGCRFQRLWGLPISTGRAARSDAQDQTSEGPPLQDEVVWADKWLSFPPKSVIKSNVIAHGDVSVGADSVVKGSIKAHGDITLARGVTVEGNVVSRGSVRLERGVRVRGNIFVEKDLFIGPNARIGHRQGHKSAYSSGKITLSKGTMVYGRLFAESGGQVL